VALANQVQGERCPSATRTSALLTLVDVAEEQLAEIDAWWRTNCPAAPTPFLDELSKARDLLASLLQLDACSKKA
jgi:hypothetical protein